jgi:glutathione peroxidase
MNTKSIYLMAFLYTILSLFGCKQVKTRPGDLQNDMGDKQTFYEYLEANPTAKVKSIDGAEVDFAQFKGKKVLIVNVASECGYTPQYEGLQKLYETYKDKLVVLGFPANNFGGQEPGSNEEIKEFCTSNYNVTFPMFEKISVTGDDRHPLYKWLTDKELNGWNDQKPKWNFGKYLLDEEGNLTNYFSTPVKPMDEEIVKRLR